MEDKIKDEYNLVIATYDGWKIERLSPFAEELKRDDIFDWEREVKDNVFECNYGGSFNYDREWSDLMPVFSKFSKEAELFFDIPKTRVSFCLDFIAGVWSNNIELSFKSLAEGIIDLQNFTK